MAKIAGRQVEVGIGIETTPGTAVAAADYFKWDTFSMTAYSDKTTLMSARGIRNKTSNSLIIKQYGKGSVEFAATVDMLPYVLGMALGSRTSGTHSGESAVYDHTFTVQNANASMKTATLLVKQGGVQTERYVNCVVDSLDLTVDKDFAKVKLGLLAGFPDTGSVSSSYTQDTMFSRNQMFAVFGSSLSTAASTAAAGTLTSDATTAIDGETVTIGTVNGPSIVYTYKTALTNGGQTPYEVLLGANAAANLTNLKKAINATGTPGTDYGFGTLAHPSVLATTVTSTTLLVTALQPGTGGNAIATTETSTHLSWGAATLASGAGNNPTPLVDFALNISNNVLFEDAFLSGSAAPGAGAFVAGPLEIKGSYTLQFADVVEYGKYKSNTLNAMIVTMTGAALGVVPTLEQIVLKLGRLVLTKAPLEYQVDGLTLVKQEFEVQYDGTDKELTAVITNGYVGTNYQ